MPSANFYLRDAVEARNSLTKRQEKDIRKLYNQWAREARREAESLKGVEGTINEQRRLAELYYQLRSGSLQLSAEINNLVSSNANEMGNIVARVNQRWLKSLGFTEDSINRKMSPAKDMAIRNILTGNLYEQKIPISSRIWNLADSNLQDMYTIIAKGIAQEQSMEHIARQLEKYLMPGKSVGWTTQIVDQNGVQRILSIHNNTVDYRAQRLARTVVQHSYQQVLVGLTRNNPFVLGYLWHAEGANACQICLDRDGQFYTASELPLDHPNGQCEMEVVIDNGIADKEIEDVYGDIRYSSFMSGLELED